MSDFFQQDENKNTLNQVSFSCTAAVFQTISSSPESALKKISKSAMEQKVNECPATTSPQKHMKNRSKSTEEMQQTKKAFSSQKSLPGRPELEKVKECPDGSDTPSSSTEELKG